MEFRELMAVLAEKTGVKDEIEIDDENRCLMEFDGMGVVIQGVDEAGVVNFLSALGEPPPEQLTGFYRALLEANHLFQGTFGATLSVAPGSGAVFLCKSIPYVALDGDKFMKDLSNFVNAVETWRTFVSDFRATDNESVEVSGGGESSNLGGLFMRV